MLFKNDLPLAALKWTLWSFLVKKKKSLKCLMFKVSFTHQNTSCVSLIGLTNVSNVYPFSSNIYKINFCKTSFTAHLCAIAACLAPCLSW